MKLTKDQKIGIGIGVGAAAALGIALAVKAAPPVAVCTPGEEKCIGSNWCRCREDGQAWIIVTPNATQCLPPPGTAVLHGKVTDSKTHAVIEGIVVDCGGYTGTTGTDGLYRISNIPPGIYTVVFSDPLNRYEPLTI